MNSTQQANLTIRALREYAQARKREADGHRFAGPSHAAHRAALRTSARDADRLAASINPPPEGTVRLHLDFAVGTVEDLGFGGLKVAWLDATSDGGTRLGLTAGAGVGTPLLEASALRKGQPGQYAKADVRDLGRTLFGILERRLDAAQEEAARQAVEEVTPQ